MNSANCFCVKLGCFFLLTDFLDENPDLDLEDFLAISVHLPSANTNGDSYIVIIGCVDNAVEVDNGELIS